MSEQTGLYVGDWIRLTGWYGQTYDLEVEMFRDCLGVFQSDQHRTAGRFTPLCELYEAGAGSERDYTPNFGEYIKNPVASWMQIPKPKYGEK
jgi:hypothetical protein